MIINRYSVPSWLGADFARGRVCGGRVDQVPSWLGAEYVRGRDVQLPLLVTEK